MLGSNERTQRTLTDAFYRIEKKTFLKFPKYEDLYWMWPELKILNRDFWKTQHQIIFLSQKSHQTWEKILSKNFIRRFLIFQKFVKFRPFFGQKSHFSRFLDKKWPKFHKFLKNQKSPNKIFRYFFPGLVQFLAQKNDLVLSFFKFCDFSEIAI